jgi:hypothetical protein
MASEKILVVVLSWVEKSGRVDGMNLADKIEKARELSSL